MSVVQQVLLWPKADYDLMQFSAYAWQSMVPAALGVGAAYWMGVDGGGIMGYGRAYLVGGVASYAGYMLMTSGGGSSK